MKLQEAPQQGVVERAEPWLHRVASSPILFADSRVNERNWPERNSKGRKPQLRKRHELKLNFRGGEVEALQDEGEEVPWGGVERKEKPQLLVFSALRQANLVCSFVIPRNFD